MIDSSRGNEIGIAANAFLVSLLRTLVDKAVPSNADVRAILTRAASGLPSHQYTAPATGAEGTIRNDALPRFPGDGGD